MERHRSRHRSRFVEMVERRGARFDGMVYDTQMLSADCFVAMGAAAVKTSRIRLGTGVLVPSIASRPSLPRLPP